MTELPRPSGGAPLWSRPRARELGPPLSGPVRADVAVVGGGITGLTLALLLQREGLSVALLEAARVASGTSGATSAHVTSVLDISYRQLLDRLGNERATAVVEGSGRALDFIRSMARSSVACSFELCPAYRYAEDAHAIPELQKDASHAVLATHTPIGTNLVQSQTEPHRSYLLALRTRSELAAGIYWDTETPYHYLRPVRWDGASLVLVGGEDHRVGHDDPLERYQALERYARERFVDVEVVRRRCATSRVATFRGKPSDLPPGPFCRKKPCELRATTPRERRGGCKAFLAQGPWAPGGIARLWQERCSSHVA